MKWLVAALAIFSFAGQAHACECIDHPRSQLVTLAGKIFVGQVIATERHSTSRGPYIQFREIVTFRVITALKGVRPGELVTSDVEIAAGSCSLSVLPPTGHPENHSAKVAPLPGQKPVPVDYRRWMVFDRPDICTGSWPMAADARLNQREVRQIRKYVRESSR